MDNGGDVTDVVRAKISERLRQMGKLKSKQDNPCFDNEAFMVRSLQKARLVCPNDVKRLKKEDLLKLGKEDLAEAVLYLDDNETHYIRQANGLIEELSLKEIFYPIYGFIAGTLITMGFVALWVNCKG